ncbi:hypothetical protein H9Q70_004014 [Fusarium xylarioides]|nr:hypothetical protein H9Q70_004014 [Fusarium xylarioides]
MSIATSKVFVFIVGPDHTEFTIHAALVAKLSPVLNVLVNGPFKEALEQRVEWTDLEEAVFLSFWEFAYSGDYTNPIQDDDEQEETDPADEELSNWGKSWAHYVRHYPTFSGPKSRNAPGLNGLWQDFVDKHAPISRPSDVGNIGADTLLHHARVCIFADRYFMDKLMDVSLGKLFTVLEAIIPWGNSWNSVMELLILASGKFVPVRLQEIVAEARESGEFTDFAFTCEGETIPVHRIIVCGQSTVFHRACTGKFKEASSGIYDLNDHPLKVVNRMVEYLYTGAYAVPEDASMLTHATMFTLADKYGIGGLQEFAGGKYLECLHQYHKFNNQDFTSSITEVYKVPREIQTQEGGGHRGAGSDY